MKFSVLLPTRNRLELLRYAVQSVLRQDYADWELVVADNDSENDVAGYVGALGEPRVRYLATGRLLPVTENWNFALSKSSSDYVIMLGDDDCLLKGYFRRLAALVESFRRPDFVYTDALQYAYPGVIPGQRQGFVQIGYTGFIGGAAEPFVLAPERARRAVAESMRFRVTFGYNMQHFLVARRMIERLARAGPFFQSPYPDYYAANVLLLKAERALVVPRPMVAIGISARSFGYYYFNRREEEGTRLLNNPLGGEEADALAGVLLPGSAMNSSWLAAMEAIRRNFPEEAGLAVDRRRYRFLQIVWIGRNRGLRGVREVWGRLSARERLTVAWLALLLCAVRALPGRLREAAYARLRDALGAYPRFDARRRDVPWRNILEVFENVEAEYY